LLGLIWDPAFCKKDAGFLFLDQKAATSFLNLLRKFFSCKGVFDAGDIRGNSEKDRK
jgi:hypothetical protein